jgi:L-tryptophan--pyruvate aminotransferase
MHIMGGGLMGFSVGWLVGRLLLLLLLCCAVCSGDPTIFESYWLTLGSQATTVIPAWQGMSYFAHKHNAFLFVDHHLELTIRELHTLVGNAVTQDRYVLLGVGSTQLFQAAIYALAANLPENSTPTTSDPIKIVSAVPFYSVLSHHRSHA